LCPGLKITFIFIKKQLSNAGMGIRRGYPNPSGTGMRLYFSSPVGMGRVTGKYMRVRYGDEEGKTRPHPRSIAMPR